MDLTTLSSLRADRTFKTVVERRFFTLRRDPLVTSCVSDAQHCGKMQIFNFGRATLNATSQCRMLKTVEKCKSSTSPEQPLTQKVNVRRSKLWQNANVQLRPATLNAKSECRMLKGVVKCKFSTSPRNPLGISCVSDAQNCGKMNIFGRTGADYCVKTVLKW